MYAIFSYLAINKYSCETIGDETSHSKIPHCKCGVCGGEGGAGGVATSRLFLVITNFRIRVHLLSPVVTNILW